MSYPSTDLDDLRKAVASASEHTQRQLTSIDGSLLLKSLFSVLISLGVSYVLKIAMLWIPGLLINHSFMECLWLDNHVKTLRQKTY